MPSPPSLAPQCEALATSSMEFNLSGLTGGAAPDVASVRVQAVHQINAAGRLGPIWISTAAWDAVGGGGSLLFRTLAGNGLAVGR